LEWYTENRDSDNSKNISNKNILSLANEDSHIKPRMALEFYKMSQTREIFEALDGITEKWEENVEKFEKQDKRDIFINGYTIEDDSLDTSPPGLQLVKLKTTSCYNAFNDPYTLRSMKQM